MLFIAQLRCCHSLANNKVYSVQVCWKAEKSSVILNILGVWDPGIEQYEKKRSYLDKCNQHSTRTQRAYCKIDSCTSHSIRADWRAATWFRWRGADLGSAQSYPKVCLIILRASAKMHNKSLLVPLRTFLAQISSQGVHMLLRGSTAFFDRQSNG